LYGRTTFRKLGPIEEEDQDVVVWVLVMQEVGLLISLQQLKLKMKVVELIQTKPTPLWGRIPRNS
jgi:hypothetical protein